MVGSDAQTEGTWTWAGLYLRVFNVGLDFIKLVLNRFTLQPAETSTNGSACCCLTQLVWVSVCISGPGVRYTSWNHLFILRLTPVYSLQYLCSDQRLYRLLVGKYFSKDSYTNMTKHLEILSFVVPFLWNGCKPLCTDKTGHRLLVWTVPFNICFIFVSSY